MPPVPGRATKTRTSDFLLLTQAPLGVAGHDVAAAALEPAVVQGPIDRLGEGQKGSADILGVLRLSREKDQAVVLIGGKGLL